jgi:hypothetical protein
MFIENFNGTFFKLDDIWVSNFDLQLYTDSAGGVGKTLCVDVISMVSGP